MQLVNMIFFLSNHRDSVMFNGLEDDEGDSEEEGGGSLEFEEKVPKGCIVRDGQLHGGFAVLMTKVDVNAGPWGLYNFYRMQVARG